jgi:hypothetical protein
VHPQDTTIGAYSSITRSKFGFGAVIPMAIRRQPPNGLEMSRPASSWYLS